MSKRILLIDDSKTQLQYLKMNFEKAGFEVVTASDGSEGYRAVFESAPDVILSDIVMPKLNGLRLCRLIKNSDIIGKIPVVLLTVLDKKLDKFWGNKSGADKFILKTEEFSNIEAIVNKLIEANPISDEYRANILKNVQTGDFLDSTIDSTLSAFLMSSVLSSEFRGLNQYISHDSAFISELCKFINTFLEYDVMGIFLNSPDNNEKKILNFDIENAQVSSFVLEKIKRDFFLQMPDVTKFSTREFAHSIVMAPENPSGSIKNVSEFKSSYIFPIIASDSSLLGGICFYSRNDVNYKDKNFHDTMVNELTSLFQLRYVYSSTEYLSVTDGLTGLYNRRHFENSIEREFMRVKRYPADLSLAMLDIDFFKKINDTYGHQFGDYVLKQVANLVNGSFRKTDMIYRYGGEEFVIILTETPIENALIPLERLREKVESFKFSYNGQETNVTISIGLSCYNKDLTSYNMLIESTDKALYHAKQTGRNKLVTTSYE